MSLKPSQAEEPQQPPLEWVEFKLAEIPTETHTGGPQLLAASWRESPETCMHADTAVWCVEHNFLALAEEHSNIYEHGRPLI